MDDIIEIIGIVAASEVDRLKEWCADVVDYIKDHTLHFDMQSMR